MGLYRRIALPWLIHHAMASDMLIAYRERVVSAACGTVLEIGIGSGHNLGYYRHGITRLIGLDPSPNLLDRARQRAAETAFPVKLLEGSAEAIPLTDSSIDTIVMTWTLCSIGDAGRALGEMRRVLKSSGRLLFVEHGLAPEGRVQRWQHRLDPFWNKFSCHLDLPMCRLIQTAGFEIQKLDAAYMNGGAKLLTYMYEGVAVLRQ